MQPSRLTLVTAGPSPYARKVAIALHEKAIAFETLYDQPWGETSITRRYSPLAQLPILLVDGEEPVYDSTFVLTWLETRFPDPPLLPASPAMRLEAMRRQMLGERLMEIAQSLIFELARDQPSQAMIARQSDKVVAIFDDLEARYHDRLATMDTRIDLGDIAVATTCMVLQYLTARGDGIDAAELRWTERCSALARFCARMNGRPSFAQTRPRPMDFTIGDALR